MFHLVPAAAGYGARIYVNSEDAWACAYLKEWCVWGGHDKSLYHQDVPEQIWYGFEFREVDPIVRAMVGMGYVQSSREEMIEFFRCHHTL